MHDVEKYRIDPKGVLREVDAVRRRPGVYVGDTEDGSGPHKMIDKLVDNAIEEARADHNPRITVTLDADGSVTVTDNGHGIETGIDGEAGISAAEVIMTGIDPGRERNVISDPARSMTPLKQRHMGLVVVNALSARLLLRIWRDGHEHEIEFAHGYSVYPLRVVGPAGVDEEGRPRCGTAVTFWPSHETFTQTEFVYGTLKRRLRKVARLNPGVRLALTDARRAEQRHDELAP